METGKALQKSLESFMSAKKALKNHETDKKHNEIQMDKIYVKFFVGSFLIHCTYYYHYYFHS